MQITLINLDRTPERLAQFTVFNRDLAKVSRFAAVDGKTLDIDSLVRMHVVAPPVLPTYTRGALGCAMSHLALWQQAVARDTIATICEDDAIFNRHFDVCAERLIGTLPDDWDFVLWGWNFDSVLSFELVPGVSPCFSHFDQQAMRAGISNFQNQQLSPRLFRLHRAFGLVCYSISPKGAKTLRDHCIPLRPMTVFFPGLNRSLHNNGIDIMTNDAYPAMKAFVCFPPLVVTENEYQTTTVQRD